MVSSSEVAGGVPERVDSSLGSLAPLLVPSIVVDFAEVGFSDRRRWAVEVAVEREGWSPGLDGLAADPDMD